MMEIDRNQLLEMNAKHLNKARVLVFDKEGRLSHCPSMEDLDRRRKSFVQYCRVQYLEASDRGYSECSDEGRNQDFADAAFLAKQQFLIEEGHLKMDDRTAAQATVLLKDVSKGGKGDVKSVGGGYHKLLLKWQHHH